MAQVEPLTTGNHQLSYGFHWPISALLLLSITLHYTALAANEQNLERQPRNDKRIIKNEKKWKSNAKQRWDVCRYINFGHNFVVNLL